MSTTRRIVVLAAAAAIALAACSDGGADTDTLLGKVEAAGQDRHVDGPAVPAAVLAQGRRHLRGLRHRRRDRDREAPRRRHRVRDPELGHHHRRLVERPLGLQRRVDDDHRAPRARPRLQQALLLHAGPDGRQHGLGDHHARRPCRQDGLRRCGHHLLRLDERDAGPRVLHPRGGTARGGRGHHARHRSPLRRDVEGRPDRLRGLAQLVDDGRRRASPRGCPSSRSATPSTTSRSRSRSTRAARIRRRWSRRSTRSSTRCAPTAR